MTFLTGHRAFPEVEHRAQFGMVAARGNSVGSVSLLLAWMSRRLMRLQVPIQAAEASGAALFSCRRLTPDHWARIRVRGFSDVFSNVILGCTGSAYYLRRFTPHGLARGPNERDRVFHRSGLCIASYASAVTGTSPGSLATSVAASAHGRRAALTAPSTMPLATQTSWPISWRGLRADRALRPCRSSYIRALACR
jgi:hypothetical protein